MRERNDDWSNSQDDHKVFSCLISNMSFVEIVEFFVWETFKIVSSIDLSQVCQGWINGGIVRWDQGIQCNILIMDLVNSCTGKETDSTRESLQCLLVVWLNQVLKFIGKVTLIFFVWKNPIHENIVSECVSW